MQTRNFPKTPRVLKAALGEMTTQATPNGDGDSSSSSLPPATSLPDDDGESSDDAPNLYKLRKRMVERKRAQQKHLTPAATKSPTKPRKDKMSYVAFVPAFVVARLDEPGGFQARVQAAVLEVRVTGLAALTTRLHREFAGPRELCRKLDDLLNTLTRLADASGGDAFLIAGACSTSACL